MNKQLIQKTASPSFQMTQNNSSTNKDVQKELNIEYLKISLLLNETIDANEKVNQQIDKTIDQKKSLVKASGKTNHLEIKAKQQLFKQSELFQFPDSYQQDDLMFANSRVINGDRLDRKREKRESQKISGFESTRIINQKVLIYQSQSNNQRNNKLKSSIINKNKWLQQDSWNQRKQHRRQQFYRINVVRPGQLQGNTLQLMQKMNQKNSQGSHLTFDQMSNIILQKRNQVTQSRKQLFTKYLKKLKNLYSKEVAENQMHKKIRINIKPNNITDKSNNKKLRSKTVSSLDNIQKKNYDDDGNRYSNIVFKTDLLNGQQNIQKYDQNLINSKQFRPQNQFQSQLSRSSSLLRSKLKSRNKQSSYQMVSVLKKINQQKSILETRYEESVAPIQFIASNFKNEDRLISLNNEPSKSQQLLSENKILKQQLKRVQGIVNKQVIKQLKNLNKNQSYGLWSRKQSDNGCKDKKKQQVYQSRLFQKSIHPIFLNNRLSILIDKQEHK